MDFGAGLGLGLSKLLEQRNLGPASKALHELMIRYAQVNNLHGVAGCVRKGADPDYASEQLLEVAVFFGYYKLLTYVLKVSKCRSLVKRIVWAAEHNPKLLAALEKRKFNLEARHGQSYFWT